MRASRIGRSCEARFWCGFCSEIVEIENKDVHAWRERFKHIDDHYHGRSGLPKKTAPDWEDVDADNPRVTVPVSSDESVSCDSSDGDDDDDDDRLGGDRVSNEAAARTKGKKRKASSPPTTEPEDQKRVVMGWICVSSLMPSSCAQKKLISEQCACSTEASLQFDELCVARDCSHQKCDHCRVGEPSDSELGI